MLLFFANMKIDTMQLLDNFKRSVQDKSLLQASQNAQIFYGVMLSLYISSKLIFRDRLNLHIAI
jgi:hypothetical protein